MHDSIPRSEFFLAAGFLLPLCLFVATAAVVVAEPVTSYPSDASNDAPTGYAVLPDSSDWIGRDPLPVQLVQANEEVEPSKEEISLRGLSERRRSLASGPATGFLSGSESLRLPTSDAGGFLGKSGSITGIGFQMRNPIVTDVRTRGNHVGQLVASGCFWAPARMDLDTMLSKVDPRIIDNMIVIKGPYSAMYGPGFNFVDFELLPAPRFPNGPESGGSSSIEYQTNGQRWYGRQSVWHGSESFGIRVSYGHKTGNDYETGAGFSIPSSYNSGDLEAAIGFDLSPDSHVDFHYLRLDQTDMEYPGLVFDMDVLVTDAFELTYVLENQPTYDLLQLETWYNRTRFAGNSFGVGKMRQIPTLACNLFPFDGSGDIANIDDFIANDRNPDNPRLGTGTAITDVDQLSTGFSNLVTWGQPGDRQVTAGVDLRYINQELNDIENQRPPDSSNFPVPPSYSTNPGIFLDYVAPLSSVLTVHTGSRADWVITDAKNDLANVGELISDRLAVTDLDRYFAMWSAFINTEYEINDCWKALAGFGYGQRPPTLTELYASGPFMGVLQTGLTAVTGDPELKPEQNAQFDLGLRLERTRFSGSVNAFYSRVEDYITFDARDLPEELLGQKIYRVGFVNTNLASLAGFELYGEHSVSPYLTGFAMMSYVEGRDHTRDKPGRFRVVDNRSGVNRPEEPLPGMPPLESLVGLRLHPAGDDPHWGIELAARMVSDQDRFAESLGERRTAGFTVLNARSYWRLRDNLLVIAGAENFTDQFYREHLDYRSGLGVFQPGANFYFSTELSY